MKKYDYYLQEWHKGSHQSAGSTKNPARTVCNTFSRWHPDFRLKIQKGLTELRLIRVEGMVGLYKDDKRINKETMIDILMKMSSFR